MKPHIPQHLQKVKRLAAQLEELVLSSWEKDRKGKEP